MGHTSRYNNWKRTFETFAQGQHGWRPDVSDMHPIFMARGPDFVNKSEPLEPFPNVDLYPLCCHLLQIEPAPNNGSLTIVKTYLGKSF